MIFPSEEREAWKARFDRSGRQEIARACLREFAGDHSFGVCFIAGGEPVNLSLQVRPLRMSGIVFRGGDSDAEDART